MKEKARLPTRPPAREKTVRSHEFRIKRVYDPPAADDGLCFLVDRLWPRGVPKKAIARAEWTRGVAPSSALRKWFGHEPSKWSEFRRRYRAELQANPSAWEPLEKAVQSDNVTLLYAARDTKINHAVALKEYLEEKSAVRNQKPD